MTIQPSPDSSSPLSLSLPPTTYAKLLPSSFLSAHLPSTRPSGRTPAQLRPTTINTSSLTHAHGSAVVRIGSTSVVCGIRAETLNASEVNLPQDFMGDGSKTDGEKIGQLGLLVQNVEVSTGCNPMFLPGNAPGGFVQSLVHRLGTTMRGADLLRLDGLRIYEDAAGAVDGEEEEREVKAYFVLYIDILFLSLDGAAFDAAWLSILAALRSTRLPAARWDPDLERVVCDPRPENYRGLSMRGSNPVAVSWSVFKDETAGKKVVLLDPDDFEDSVCMEGGEVVVDFDSNGVERILRVEKTGGSFFGVEEMGTVLDKASERWQEWGKLLGEI